MVGLKVRRFEAHINVCLEDLVPCDSFYRHVEAKLDLSFVRDLVKDTYSAFGRPSIDPVVFFKLQLVMFFEGIRSERQLLDVAADRLSVRWYHGYDLHELLPDHSSMTRIRDCYGVAIFGRFFDTIVEQCCETGLVWGKELYFDATQVEANADRDKMLPRFYVDAVNAHLAELFPANTAPSPEDSVPAPEPDSLPVPLPLDLPPEVRTNLAAANAQRHDWITHVGRPNRAETHGDYQRIADLWVSTTDPDATLMRKKGGGVHLGYHTHYAVDGGKARIILAALVTPSEVMENQPMLDLLWRARFRWHLPLEQVSGDTTYGTVENIVALEDAGIRAYMPLPDFEQRTPFGEGKDWHGMERFRLRMLHKVNIEGLLIAAGQNLKRLLSWRGWGRHWWPSGALGVVIPSDFFAHSLIPA
jgi:transposase